jgi:hypothetical protein
MAAASRHGQEVRPQKALGTTGRRDCTFAAVKSKSPSQLYLHEPLAKMLALAQVRDRVR